MPFLRQIVFAAAPVLFLSGPAIAQGYSDQYGGGGTYGAASGRAGQFGGDARRGGFADQFGRGAPPTPSPPDSANAAAPSALGGIPGLNNSLGGSSAGYDAVFGTTRSTKPSSSDGLSPLETPAKPAARPGYADQFGGTKRAPGTAEDGYVVQYITSSEYGKVAGYADQFGPGPVGASPGTAPLEGQAAGKDPFAITDPFKAEDPDPLKGGGGTFGSK